MERILVTRALKDITEGFSLWRIWFILGWRDLKLRYRRSIIGPFWITLSMAVMIYSMGFLYGKLFKADLSVYYPFLAAGIVTWNMISTNITESAEVFTSNANFLKQVKLPYATYILRMLARNSLIFLHNIVAVIPIILIFKVPISILSIVVLICNIFLLNLCGFSYAYIVSILGTRFQDIKQIIISVVQILFMLTPIMWMPTMIPERFNFLSIYNPFYQLVTLIRVPLLGHVPSMFTYVYILAFMLAGYCAMFLLLTRCRHRIAFWV